MRGPRKYRAHSHLISWNSSHVSSRDDNNYQWSFSATRTDQHQNHSTIYWQKLFAYTKNASARQLLPLQRISRKLSECVDKQKRRCGFVLWLRLTICTDHKNEETTTALHYGSHDSRNEFCCSPCELTISIVATCSDVMLYQYKHSCREHLLVRIPLATQYEKFCVLSLGWPQHVVHFVISSHAAPNFGYAAPADIWKRSDRVSQRESKLRLKTGVTCSVHMLEFMLQCIRQQVMWHAA